MSELYGYAGKILYVDLSKQKFMEEKLQPDVARKYIGGSGLAAYIIATKAKLDAEPFSEDNLLVFASGPVTLPYIPTSSRLSIASRSPSTRAWGEARVGTAFPHDLKKTGYDAIVVHGRSEEPVWIYIEEDHVEIRDASKMWGKNTGEVFDLIRSSTGKKEVSALAIGIAGENLVKYAAIVSNEGGVAGRTGLGAVMGYKKLKAIAVAGGKRSVPVANEEKLKEYAKQLTLKMYNSPGGKRLRDYGTAGAVDRYYQLGNIPIKNFSKGLWSDESVKKISGQYLREKFFERHSPCFNCPIMCKRLSRIRVNSKELLVRTPDYETVCMLGSNLLIDDTTMVIYANHLCNEYGLDTISLGGVLGFAFEAYEKGLITKEDTGGLELRFGDAKILPELIEKISKREGKLWYILGEGVKFASEFIGRGSYKFAVHVKGLEAPAHDGRAFFVQGLSYATINRGACHLAWPHRVAQGSTYPEIGIREPIDRFQVDGSWFVVKQMQDFMEIFDSLIICKYAISAGLGPKEVVDLLHLTTGWDVNIAEVMKIGERTFNLKRLLNIKWGITSKDDKLPPRMMEPLPEGGAAGKVPDLDRMLREYYKVRGWSETGVPTMDKLKELELNTPGLTVS